MHECAGAEFEQMILRVAKNHRRENKVCTGVKGGDNEVSRVSIEGRYEDNGVIDDASTSSSLFLYLIKTSSPSIFWSFFVYGVLFFYEKRKTRDWS